MDTISAWAKWANGQYSPPNPFPDRPYHHPMSFLASCAYLSFLPEDTKLGWKDRYITFYSPTWLQGAVRNLSHEGGKEIPFDEVAEQANLMYGGDPTNHTQKMIELAILGLERLKKTYQKDPNQEEVVQRISQAIQTLQVPPKSVDLQPNQLKFKEIWDDSTIVAVEKIFARWQKSLEKSHKKSLEELENIRLALEAVIHAADDRMASLFETHDWTLIQPHSGETTVTKGESDDEAPFEEEQFQKSSFMTSCYEESIYGGNSPETGKYLEENDLNIGGLKIHDSDPLKKLVEEEIPDSLDNKLKEHHLPKTAALQKTKKKNKKK